MLIQLVTVRQNLGMLLQNKLNQKLKLSKNIFYKNVLLNYYFKREKTEKQGWFLTWSFTNQLLTLFDSTVVSFDYLDFCLKILHL